MSGVKRKRQIPIDPTLPDEYFDYFETERRPILIKEQRMREVLAEADRVVNEVSWAIKDLRRSLHPKGLVEALNFGLGAWGLEVPPDEATLRKLSLTRVPGGDILEEAVAETSKAPAKDSYGDTIRRVYDAKLKNIFEEKLHPPISKLADDYDRLKAELKALREGVQGGWSAAGDRQELPLAKRARSDQDIDQRTAPYAIPTNVRPSSSSLLSVQPSSSSLLSVQRTNSAPYPPSCESTPPQLQTTPAGHAYSPYERITGASLIALEQPVATNETQSVAPPKPTDPRRRQPSAASLLVATNLPTTTAQALWSPDDEIPGLVPAQGTAGHLNQVSKAKNRR